MSGYIHLIRGPEARVEITECCGEPYHNPKGLGYILGVTYDQKLVTCPTWVKTQKKIAALVTPHPTRPDWDEYFLGIARAVSARADCTRRQVGAVIVNWPHNRIVATGYNGAWPKGPSCLAGECPRGLKSTEQVAPGSSYDTGAGSCIALHAEQNALLYCSREDRQGGVCYVTCAPCDGCMRMLKGSGLAEVVYSGEDGEIVTVDLKDNKGGYIKGNR